MKTLSKKFVAGLIFTTMLSSSTYAASASGFMMQFNAAQSGDSFERDDRSFEPSEDSDAVREEKLKSVCLDKYLKAKAEYLTAASSYADSKMAKAKRDNNAGREIFLGALATGLSVYFGSKTDDYSLGRGLAWTTGTLGAVAMVDGIAKRASSPDAEVGITSRHRGFKVNDKGEIQKPDVPKLCSGLWDMETYDDPQKGMKCELTLFNSYGKVFDEKSDDFADRKGFLCYSEDERSRVLMDRNNKAYENFISGYEFDEKGRIQKDCRECH